MSRSISGRVMPVVRSTWFLGVVVALLSWPVRPVLPAGTADPSWQFALNHAAEYRLDFGTEVIFTYGPLGFLKVPLVAYGGPAFFAALYAIYVQLALGWTVVWAARRSFPTPAAFVIALISASLASQLFIAAEAIIIVVFICCVGFLTEDRPPVSWRVFAVAAGLVSSVEILGKLNTGLLILGMTGIAVLAYPGAPRLRATALFGVTAAGSAFALWLASGQTLGNFPDYLKTGFEVISGYTRGHTVDLPAVQWDYLAAASMMLAALAATIVATKSLKPSLRLGVGAIVALLLFALFKQAFVFRVFVFMPLFVSGMLAPWLAFRWRGGQRVAAVAAMVAIGLLYFPLSQGALTWGGVKAVIDPFERAVSASERLRQLLIPAERDAARSQARAGLIDQYRFDPATLGLLANRTVAIHPWEFTIAWAYDLAFEPLPVVGTYTTYTDELDFRNAVALAAESGPERVVRHREGVAYGGDPAALSPSRQGLEGRYVPWEGGRTTLAMLCNFKALRTTPGVQVLGRVTDRCGERRLIETHSVNFGEPIPLPRVGGDRLVYADVSGLQPSGAELLRTALWRSAFRYVTFDDQFAYRIFPDIETDLIVNVPKRIDFPAPFALSADTRTLTFSKQAGVLAGGADALTVSFYSLEVRT